MAHVVTDCPITRLVDLDFLKAHLPRSLGVLRRLQNAKSGGAGAATEFSHYLLSRDDCAGHQDENKADGGGAPRHFAAAYLDFSKAPETEMWLYSTLEDEQTPAEETEHVLDLVVALLRRVRELAASSASAGLKLYRDRGVLVGALHERTRALLVSRGMTCSYFKPHDKWLFRVERLPAGLRSPLTEDMRWDVVRREDCPIVISRTQIPKVEATLMSLPSRAVRLTDGTPIAWAFIGVEGTLATLHCEEAYRGRGIAKAVAIKILQDHAKEVGNDGWGAADVHVGNAQSQGLCKSIGGEKAWRESWSVVDFDSIP